MLNQINSNAAFEGWREPQILESLLLSMPKANVCYRSGIGNVSKHIVLFYNIINSQ